MSVDTVPRPPSVDTPISQPDEPFRWGAAFASMLVMVLVAMPSVAAFLTGFVVRCAVLVAAAAAEAYDVGRGPRG